tara:strand:- start:241 stop:660 length:420 start_codon:yes stop_codon:yes gene_type:complete
MDPGGASFARHFIARSSALLEQGLEGEDLGLQLQGMIALVSGMDDYLIRTRVREPYRSLLLEAWEEVDWEYIGIHFEEKARASPVRCPEMEYSEREYDRALRSLLEERDVLEVPGVYDLLRQTFHKDVIKAIFNKEEEG